MYQLKLAADNRSWHVVNTKTGTILSTHAHVGTAQAVKDALANQQPSQKQLDRAERKQAVGQ